MTESKEINVLVSQCRTKFRTLTNVTSMLAWGSFFDMLQGPDVLNASFTYIHTYIIGHYNFSIKIIGLVSHTTYVLCFSFIHKWRHLNSTLNDRFFVKLFMLILFTLTVFARNLLKWNRQRNTFCILFCCLALGSNPGFTFNKPTYYLLDYGDLVHRSA